jgi:hypothetical protein
VTTRGLQKLLRSPANDMSHRASSQRPNGQDSAEVQLRVGALLSNSKSREIIATTSSEVAFLGGRRSSELSPIT